MIRSRPTVLVLALAAVTLVGAGACASGPRADGSPESGRTPVSVAGQATGAGGSPGPDQRRTPTPAVTPSRKAPVTSSPTPTPTKSRPAPTGTTRPASGCVQGEHQRAVEAYLAQLGGFGTVTVDGQQSTADCAAIRKFQQRYDIRPATGRAGPTTLDVAKRLATTDVRACRAGSGTTFCIDLTRQTTWAMRDGKVIMKPTVTRTGMPGYATPAGTFKINFRNVKEWSDPYEVWLPYWQHFTQGMGFHQTTTYLHNKAIGSHGCVNLLPADAVRMWQLGRVGTTVKLIGRRPGT